MPLGLGQLEHALLDEPCEPMVESVRYRQRNVKRRQDGDMHKRWTAAEHATGQAIVPTDIGYRHLVKLVMAIEHQTRIATNNRDRQDRQAVTF